MNKALKTKSVEFFSAFKKNIYKSTLIQYALVLILNLILFSCIEILPVYYTNLYVIKQRMAVLFICILVILFSMFLQTLLLTYAKHRSKLSFMGAMKCLLWFVIILLFIVVFSAVISILISALQTTPMFRATVTGERLPNYFSYLIFPIYSISITTIVLTSELSVTAYFNKWTERFKEAYMLLLIAGTVLGNIQLIFQLFMEKPIPQIVSVIFTSILWTMAALYEKKDKRGKNDEEQKKD